MMNSASRRPPSAITPNTPFPPSVSAESSPMCATTESLGCITAMRPGAARESKHLQASGACMQADVDREARAAEFAPADQRAQRRRQREVAQARSTHHVMQDAGVAG